MFKGHKFIKLDGDWVFDATDFVLYKIKVAGGKVLGYIKKIIFEFTEVNKYIMIKKGRVPKKVEEKAKNFARHYGAKYA